MKSLPAVVKGAAIVVVAVIIAGTIGAIVLGRAWRTPSKIQKWWTLDAVQVLEGSNEIWVFADVEGRVTNPHPLASPDVQSYASHQVVAVLDREGLRDSVDPSDGPSFSPNLGWIFRRDGHFYLYESQSMSHPSALYLWDGRKFNPLLQPEFDALADALDVHNTNLGDMERRLNAETESDGWAAIYRSNVPWNLDAKCAKVGVRVRLVGAGRSWKLIAESLDNDQAWTATIASPAEVPTVISEVEYDALIRHGH